MLFCLFILYYVVEEILELRIHKFSYFKSIWNILDIVVILVRIRRSSHKFLPVVRLGFYFFFLRCIISLFLQLAVVAIIFNIFRTIKVDNLLGKLLEHPDIYADFEFLAFWQMQYNNMNAVNLFFAWIKVECGSGL